MTGLRQAEPARTRASHALTDARRRAGGVRPYPGGGPDAVLGLQRAAGNAAVNALMLAKLRSPSEQGIVKVDAALRELRRDEPAIDTLEDGLKAARATGVHVDLEGIRPPASALAVTTTGFGPGAVPTKKPVPPPKPVPAINPLGKAAVTKGGKARSAPRTGKSPGPGTAPRAVRGGDGSAPAPQGVDELKPPVPPVTVHPRDDPAFAAVVGNVKDFARAKGSHPPAASKAEEAQAAALAPAGDVAAQAAAAKTDSMDAQQAGTFDRKAFIAAVKAAIEAKSPTTLKEADEYKESGKAKDVKNDVQGLVTEGKDGQSKNIEAATRAPPDASKAVPKPVTPMSAEHPGPTVPIPASGATPKPAPAEQLNLQGGKHQVTGAMAEGEVTEEQLAESGEPDFEQALVDKKEAAAHADRAPGEYRELEQQVIGQSRAEAGATTTDGVAGMQGAKGAALAKLVAAKGTTKSKDEQQRAQVTTKVQAIFDATQDAVTKILDGIDPKVEKEFDRGEKVARAHFENYVSAKMSAYKKDRYGGWTGKYRWLRDKIRGMPSKVNEFYAAGRELYLQKMDIAISRVADIVGRDLTAAKTRIASGKREIATYVASLPQNLRKVGAQASAEIGESFTQLENEVQSKQESVVDSLATKYVTARKGLDERIEALQAENRGLVDKVVGAIKAIVNTIRELAAMLRNVLSRVAGVVGQIIKAPVKFLGNLIDGIKGGINRFREHFVEHLRTGLMSWLFGALAEGGVEVPDSFDLKGVITLLGSLFGLTWHAIRERIVKRIGAKAMEVAVSGVEIFKKLAGGGVGALWEMLLEQLGDIKEMILEKVKDFVLTKIVVAGITWLISLLNPAAAFIKACKLIYDVVMFFVSNASRIAQFVDTIIDSVADIVRGNVGGVVAKIEQVLSQMLPIIIGFLASVIGLGGIGAKIREIVQQLRKPVTRAIDAVIDTGLKLAAPLLRGLKGVSTRVKAKVAAGEAWVRGKAAAGRTWVTGRANRLRRRDHRTLEERRNALASAMQQGQRLLGQPAMSTGAIRDALSTIRRATGVRRLELHVDERTVNTESVHIVGANSPTVEGPRVTRRIPVLQTSAEDDVTATGPAATLEVGGELFTVWRLGGDSIRVRIEQGDEATIKSRASAEAAVKQFTTGPLEMDALQARQLVDALAEKGFLTRQLLLQYMSNESHGMRPEDFAAFLSKRRLGTRASIQRPVGKSARELLVDKGTTFAGEQRMSPLTSIAQVFYPRRMGEWRSRQIQATGGEGSKGVEFIFVEGSQKEQKSNPRGLPTVISLGVVDIDDNGVVVRILSATSQAGGEEGLLHIMKAAGWPIQLLRGNE